MAAKQIWITRTENLQPVIDAARETFPDAASDSIALTRALFHWFHGRQENSKRGSLDRIETKLDLLIELITKIEVMEDDTDHG